MRLYPPVPLIRRSITNETKLGGFTVPVGANVTVQIYALHHNEEYFPEPYAFKPERFHVDQTVGRHAFAFVPFSAGPRNCIGTIQLLGVCPIFKVETPLDLFV